ncbi:MAG TPA: RHS repeat-associated core domain-containing protein [Ktedonobacterales bacterium]|nr:RHS repeat-associated core domain-containing protein [Ktedonobacterales bacterium]
MITGANLTDAAYYSVTKVFDANNHYTRTMTDALGHTRYVETFTGNNPWTLYGATEENYDYLGDVTSVYEPNPSGSAGLGTSTQTQTTYNLLGQATQVTDADRGTSTMTYDANGNVTKQVDPRGSSGTVFIGYDGLNRVIWRNTSNSPTGAYVTDTYDQTSGGHGDGIGRLTTENFTNGGGGSSVSLSGSHSYTYDARGQITSQTETVAGTGYTFGLTYNDAGQPSSLTYSDNEVLSYGYNNYGWLTSLITTPSGGSATNLLTNISYAGPGGPAGHPTGASVGNGAYTYSASYDTDERLSSESLTNTSTGVTVYSSSRGYDPVGNVTSVTTTLATGTDTQAFCYDEFNRLTWAGSTGTPSCGGSVQAGTLTSANYTEVDSYDAIGRLTSNSTTGGSYTYGDSTHVHAVTEIGSTYHANYDAAGDITCRATGGAVCGGSSAQSLSYSNERQLAHWQNAPSSPTVQDDFLYDGAGARMEQSVNTSGTITATAYLLKGAEESTGGVITKYLGVAGLPSAVRVGSTLSYLTSDVLGSVSEAFDTNGNVIASQLYTPYGQMRYSSGVMPTAKGFTGQRADSVTGLDYYTARYYDPQVGQFVSADTVKAGLSPYAYVMGNPETKADPSGHCPWCIVAVTTLIGVAVATASVVQAAHSGNLNTGTWVRAGADVALGFSAGVALSLNPAGAGIGLAGAVIGVAVGAAVSHRFNYQSAFESIAIGTTAGALGGAASSWIASNIADAGRRSLRKCWPRALSAAEQT